MPSTRSLGDEGRALPGERAGERAAGDVLGDAVEQAGERDLLRSVRPVVGEDLVGPSPEEQGVHAPRLLEHDLAGLLVRQWRLPSAVREAAVAVLVGPSRRLCHSVERHELGHDELAHGVFLFLVAMRPHVDDTAVPNSSRRTGRPRHPLILPAGSRAAERGLCVWRFPGRDLGAGVYGARGVGPVIWGDSHVQVDDFVLVWYD